MGRPDSVMQCYLSDKGRFADLFNGIFFGENSLYAPATCRIPLKDTVRQGNRQPAVSGISR